MKTYDDGIVGGTEVPKENRQTPQETNLIDMGVLLHEHATTLVALLQALNPVIDSLGPNPFEGKGEPTIEEVEEMLERPVSSLTFNIEKLITDLQDDWKNRGISDDHWNDLNERHAQLQNYPERVKRPAFRAPFLRQSARLLITLLENMRGDKLPRERVKNVIFHAKNVERLVCLYDLALVKSRIISMDRQLQTLRDYITASARPKQPRRELSVRNIVTQVMHSLEPFAKDRRMELRLNEDSVSSRVEVVENDVRRALINILHNAIKYSWRMRGEQAAWVLIGYHRKGDYAYVDFQNWGVPIKDDEIEQGLIFQMGYRGSLSGDLGRPGSGIGLHDAKQTAVEHGGNVTVTSVPARDANPNEAYKQPYITTVVFTLPVKS